MSIRTAKGLRTKLTDYLVELRLPTIRSIYEEVAQDATKNSLSYEQYLYDLIETECDDRKNNRIKRLLKASRLPLEKRLDQFKQDRLPILV